MKTPHISGLLNPLYSYTFSLCLSKNWFLELCHEPLQCLRQMDCIIESNPQESYFKINQKPEQFFPAGPLKTYVEKIINSFTKTK